MAAAAALALCRGTGSGGGVAGSGGGVAAAAALALCRGTGSGGGGARGLAEGARRYYRFQQERPVFTTAENKGEVKVMAAAENKGEVKVMAGFPNSAQMNCQVQDSLKTEVMKLKFEVKHHKYISWTAISMLGGLAFVVRSVPEELDGLKQEFQVMKSKLMDTQVEVKLLKKQMKTATPPSPTPIPATTEGGGK